MNGKIINNKGFPWRCVILFFLILLAGAYFRFVGLNWDEKNHLHPDERFLTMVETAISPVSGWREYFNTDKSSLNPHNRGFGFYVYGTLPLFIVRYAADWTGMAGYDKVCLLGRGISASLDLLSLVPVYLIAARLYRRRTGLLAMAFAALAVLQIQLSHFFIVDTFANFFLYFAIYLAVLATGVSSQPRLLLTVIGFAVMAGLAMASKINAFPVVFLLPAAFALRTQKLLLRQAVGYLILAGIVCFLTFRTGQPYAFQGPGFYDIRPNPKWISNLNELRRQTGGQVETPPALQWMDRPVWFSGKNLILWGLGIPLGLTAGAGFLWMAGRIFKGEWRKHLLVWGWVGVFFIWQSLAPNSTLRYQMPIYPALAILAAWLIIRLHDNPKPNFKWAGLLLGLVVLTGTFLWAFAFTRIYTRPVTRLQASEWMFANLAPGTTIAVESSWDDSVPMSIGGRNPSKIYKFENFEMYWPDNKDKLERFLLILNKADIIAISSNRQWASITRLPWRFPLTTAFYQHLIGGLEYRDIPACFLHAVPGKTKGDLGFDLIATFESSPNIGSWQINDQAAEEAFTVYDHPKVLIFKKNGDYNPDAVRKILSAADLSQVRKNKNDLLLPESRRTLQGASGTWSEIFNSNACYNRRPFLAAVLWYLTLFFTGLLAWPLLRLVMPGLSDGGYPIARTAGMLFVSYLVWLAGSLNLPFNSLTITAAVVLLIVASGIALFFRTGRPFLPFTYYLGVESLFLVFFAACLMIRWANPDLWHPYHGGEKPMDFAYFNAVLKSSAFPPYDPWFAGGYINYYYFGFVFIGVFVKWLGIVPAVAYNLAVPTLFALTAMGALCLGWNLSDRRKKYRPWLIGIAAAVGLVLLGNLGTVKMIVQGILPWPDTFNWCWFPSRIIPPGPGEPGPITEFPFFTFLFGDLHAHMIDLPITLLALAWAVSTALYKKPWTHPRLLIAVAAGALIVGALRVTNTWDFPVYVLLGSLALAYTTRKPIRMIVTMMFFFVLSILLYRPFDWWYGQGYTSIDFWAGSHTPLIAYLTHWGLFLFILLAWLTGEALSRFKDWTQEKWIAMILAGTALALTAMVEIIVLAGDVGRMNTVFKFYLQAWTLLAVSSAAALGWFRPKWKIWWALLALLALAAGLYPVAGTWAKIRDRISSDAPRTLDGSAYMHYASLADGNHTMSLKYDFEAIRWMQEHVKGSPVIVEANTPGYRWGARFSVYTGLPSVVGWDWHQHQQRLIVPPEWITRRIDDVRNFYSTPSLADAQAFLKKYHVRYIIVGDLERTCYPRSGLEKFKRWKPVYQNPGTAIYETP